MTSRWILISNASQARLYRDGSPTHPFECFETFEHPESRAKVLDLMSDMNGRKPSGRGPHGAQPGAAPDTDPKQVEAQKFARELSEKLTKGAQQRSFDSLVIAAPPHFLGLLRRQIHGEVERRVELTLDKDLTHTDDREMERMVRSELPKYPRP